MGVDVGDDDVGLNLVARHILRRQGVIDRVQHVPQICGAVAVAHERVGQHDPGGGVRVLRAVLTDAGRVALDVTRVECAPVERRREQVDDVLILVDELGSQRLHGDGLFLRVARAGDDSPSLRD